MDSQVQVQLNREVAGSMMQNMHQYLLGSFPIIAMIQICQSSPVQLLIGKSERLYICVVVCLVVRHDGDSSDVTLDIEHAQVIQTLMDDE